MQLYRPVEVQQALPALRLEILDVLSLVQNQVPPGLSSERLVILQHQLVRSDAHVESIRLRPALRIKNNVVKMCVFLGTETCNGEKRLTHYLSL